MYDNDILTTHATPVDDAQHHAPTEAELMVRARQGVREGVLRTRLRFGEVREATIMLLGASSLAALIESFDIAPTVGWLMTLGAGTLAGWLAGWDAQVRRRLLRDGMLEPEQQILRLAADLQCSIDEQPLIVDDLAILLDDIEAIPVALDALAAQSNAQRELLRQLQRDAQRSGVVRGRLQRLVTTELSRQREIREQIQRDVQARLDDSGTLADDERLDLAVQLLEALPLDALPEPAPLPVPNRMLLSRNPLFVGREAELKAAAAILKRGDVAVITPADGCAGAGTTQLADEFVYRYGQYFSGGVFWLSFADARSVPALVAACGGAAALNLPDFASLPLEAQIKRVREAWRSPLPRLLVFDGCESMALLAQWRPVIGGSRVLMTSPRTRWDGALGVARVALGVLRREESIALLRRFRPDLPEGAADLDALAAELGDLPLALHLAGSVLMQYQRVLIPAAYLAELRAEALNHHPMLQVPQGAAPLHEHEQRVARAFVLAYTRLDPDDPTDTLALELLARAACLAPGEPIPVPLLASAVEALGRDAVLQTEEAVQRLADMGLLVAETGDLVRIHRLFWRCLLAGGDITDAQEGVETALLRAFAVPRDAAILGLQPHLQHVTDRVFLREDVRAAQLCQTLATYLEAAGDYVAARPCYERALTVRERVLGAEHPDTVSSLQSLIALLDRQGEAVEARPYYERVLALRQRTLGPQHPETAAVLQRLGAIQHAQGALDEARAHYEQALAIREQVLGPLHAHTATTLYHLGVLLQRQGEYAAAQGYYERALAAQEHALGSQHAATGTTLHHLGYVLQAQGAADAARQAYERALLARTQALGSEHPDTAATLNHLGFLLDSQGNSAEARGFYERALAARTQALGSEHPATATSLNNLGLLLLRMGEIEAARSHLEQALTVFATHYGDNHPLTSTVQDNLQMLDRFLRRET